MFSLRILRDFSGGKGHTFEACRVRQSGKGAEGVAILCRMILTGN